MTNNQCHCEKETFVRKNGTTFQKMKVGGRIDPNCPIHETPGCPNPACGETWIKVFHWPTCESCGWQAPTIEELPTALDLSA